jgi:hypothetical protein
MEGPCSDADFRQFRETGAVRDTTLIWRTGWKAWTSFAELWKASPESATQEKAGLPSDPDSDVTNDEPPPLPLRLAEPIVESTLITPIYAKCSVCREPWAEHLLFGTGRLRVCAKCLKAHEQSRRQKQNRRSQSIGTDGGTASWLVKLFLIGMALAGIIILSLSSLKPAANDSPPSRFTPAP